MVGDEETGATMMVVHRKTDAVVFERKADTIWYVVNGTDTMVMDGKTYTMDDDDGKANMIRCLRFTKLCWVGKHICLLYTSDAADE